MSTFNYSLSHGVIRNSSFMTLFYNHSRLLLCDLMSEP
ncbi:hypothetical protein T06_2555 [Trichinella sp. T6]|nr:hypothetical protein T06_2555 [Trichinella sp. T6]